MRYADICAGISAPTVAWAPLGWTCAFHSEIAAFPRAVLRHRYPDTPLEGDFTKLRGDEHGPVDLIVGGTPCQSFSVAGLRGGLADDRGNLALEFLRLAERMSARWIVWENVPGVLSSLSHAAPDPCPPPPPVDLERDGAEMETEDDYDSEELHAFNCFLAGLSELGYGYAYRRLDAQHFGVPQRRARVFVVGYLGDWRPAAAVLFERESLSGHPAPSRKAGKDVAAGLRASASPRGHGNSSGLRGDGQDNLIAGTLESGGNRTGGPRPPGTTVDTTDYLIAAPQAPPLTGNRYGDHESREGLLVTHSLRAEGFDAGEDGTGRGTPIIPTVIKGAAIGRKPENGPQYGEILEDGTCYRLNCTEQHAIAFHARQDPDSGEVTHPLDTDGTSIAIAFDTTQITSRENRSQPAPDKPCHGLSAGAHPPAVAYTLHGADKTVSTATPTDIAGSIRTKPPGSIENSSTTAVLQRMSVRRLTPVECERLQDFPDGWTAVPYRGKPAADGPRYQALGNSMAVPVLRWIGERIDLVSRILERPAA